MNGDLETSYDGRLDREQAQIRRVRRVREGGDGKDDSARPGPWVRDTVTVTRATGSDVINTITAVSRQCCQADVSVQRNACAQASLASSHQVNKGD